MLKARCDLPVREAERLLSLFCEHYGEHSAVKRRGAVGRFAMGYGRFVLHASSEGVSFRVRAADETGLTYIKMGVVAHLREFLEAALPPVRWSGDGPVGGTPPFWREMRVVQAFDVTAAMRRVVLAGPDLTRFAQGGLHVRLFFPPPGRPLRWPVLGEDGVPVWPDGEDALTARVYTIREIDLGRGEVSIDILRHDGDATPGSFFAANAAPGDVVGMAGPLGDEGLPPGERLFLFGDETAIPAIDRILRRLPAGRTAHAVVEVADRGEEQPLESAAALSVTWLHRRAGGPRLAEAAREATAGGIGPGGYVWAACEYADFTEIRRHCRATLGLKRDSHHVVAYWRRGAKPD